MIKGVVRKGAGRTELHPWRVEHLLNPFHTMRRIAAKLKPGDELLPFNSPPRFFGWSDFRSVRIRPSRLRGKWFDKYIARLFQLPGSRLLVTAFAGTGLMARVSIRGRKKTLSRALVGR